MRVPMATIAKHLKAKESPSLKVKVNDVDCISYIRFIHFLCFL